MTASTLTVTDFMLARLAEDEITARAATDGPWKVDNEIYTEYIGSPSGAVVSGSRWGGEASVFDNTADAIHIARHDPARVLAQCAAMRKIVEQWQEGAGRLDDQGRPAYLFDPLASALLKSHAGWLRILASIWSDHPDWREEWRA